MVHEPRSGIRLRVVLITVLLSAALLPGLWPARVSPTATVQPGAHGTGTTHPVLARLTAATAYVTAHDDAFWADGQQVVFRGFDLNASSGTGGEVGKIAPIAGAGANVIRLWVHWVYLEPTPPVKNPDGTWTHTYSSDYLQLVQRMIWTASQNGMYTLIDNHACGEAQICSDFGFPGWLYQAQYNSHGITYSSTTAEGRVQAQTDFWSDPLRQQFQLDEWKYLARNVDGMAGILGYEVLNEPQKGSLDSSHTTTQMILDWQLSLAKAIRAIDPARIVFFATRAGYGPGLGQADLSGFTTLPGQPVGNVAFDLHDYFGARWGDGILDNPDSPAYLEASSALFNHVIQDDAGPYIGTTYSQIRFIRQAQLRLAARGGIPLLVGEFGDPKTDPGIYVYYGTTTSAYSQMGISWTGFWGGRLGITTDTGAFQPWAYLVLGALK